MDLFINSISGSDIYKNNLIIDYRYRENLCYPESGSNINDLSVEGSNGSNQASFVNQVDESKDVEYFDFIGTDKHIYIPEKPVFGTITDQLTVEYWALWDSSLTHEPVPTMVGKRPSQNVSTTSFFLLRNFITQSGKVICSISIGGTGYILISDTIPTDDEWNHIAFTYDGAQLILYINGVQQSTIVPVSGNINTNNSGILLGAMNGNSGRASVHNDVGKNSEFRLYKEALTEELIIHNYNVTKNIHKK